jgi:hypothetical protein
MNHKLHLKNAKKMNSAYSSAKKVFTSCGIKADTPNVYNDQKLHLNGSKLQGIFERQKSIYILQDKSRYANSDKKHKVHEYIHPMRAHMLRPYA